MNDWCNWKEDVQTTKKVVDQAVVLGARGNYPSSGSSAPSLKGPEGAAGLRIPDEI